MEDKEIKNNGIFYTPKPFADYAHRMIEKQFGNDWKEKYVVWDNSAGLKALTRDYYFSRLFCSTLFEEEVEQSKDFNKEATSFQFDFLNDDLSKLPSNLLADLKANKPLLFLINPPYATAGVKGEESKKGCADTLINKQMLADNIGACSQNLYAQFLYRIILIKREFNLTNVNICCFTPTLFLSGSSYAKFRNSFFNEFEYKEGMQFCASHFSNCSSNWGIGFTIWVSGKTINKSEFELELTDYIEDSVKSVGSKVVYNLDSLIKASEWVKENVKNDTEFPNLSSGISIKEKDTKWNSKAFGYFYTDGSNNVDKNAQGIAVFSAPFSNAHGINVLPANFTRCTALFSARRLVSCDWINSKDEYLKPNTDCAEWSEFENDSIIYSLFESKSNQSSLRGIEYKGKKWNIKNEFFFMAKEEILNLANENNNVECSADCAEAEERYVYTLLNNGLKKNLSKEAYDVISYAEKLVKESFKYRVEFNRNNPKYQVNNWDCGYYQLKALWKEYMPEEFKVFKDKFKALEDKMRPMVYRVGFLLDKTNYEKK